MSSLGFSHLLFVHVNSNIIENVALFKSISSLSLRIKNYVLHNVITDP